MKCRSHCRALHGRLAHVSIVRSRLASVALGLLLLVSACAPTAVTEGPSAAAELLTTAAFPDLSVATLQNRRHPGSIDHDRGLLLGGVGSDLWRSASDPAGEFWMVTDRGPNGQVRAGGKNRRTFPIPEYTPVILRVRVDGASVQVLDSIPVVGQSGRPVTGLPNVDGRDEAPYDYSGQIQLPYSPSGLDIEGLVRTASGDFWIVDEYGPSLVRLDASGTVRTRYVPEGHRIVGADYPVVEALPALYARRVENRGFEGLTMSPDGGTLYLALQSPLANPNKKTGERSRNVRILTFDVAADRVTAEYVYRFEPVAEFDSTVASAPEEMKLSGLALAGPNLLLVLERTDHVAKLYLADLTQATDIHGTLWASVTIDPSIEAVEDLGAVGVTPARKTLAADLASIADMPGKIEGVAIVDRTTVAIANDNDFDVGNFDRSGNNVGQGLESKIWLVRLPRPLPEVAPARASFR
jgi:hypothetical protein